MNHQSIKITESPRDAQQGLSFTIPVEKRAAYINALMSAGFDVIDFGSFVSPKAVPQMADSNQVLDLVDKSNSKTQLLAVVGNKRGAEEASACSKLDIVGFPYSISNTFLQKNINSSIEKIDEVSLEIGKVCADHKKDFRVFISMAFGNPYGDEWSPALVEESVKKLVNAGVKIITLSDTIGKATTTSIQQLFENLLPIYPQIEIGLHIHTEPHQWREKIDAAWKAGCRSYDGVINGIGGCPMTGYELLGNLNTLSLLSYLEEEKISNRLNRPLIKAVAAEYGTFNQA